MLLKKKKKEFSLNSEKKINHFKGVHLPLCSDSKHISFCCWYLTDSIFSILCIPGHVSIEEAGWGTPHYVCIFS